MTGPDLGRLLCEAWGLDANQVMRIVIDISAGRLPTVTVTLLGDGPMEVLTRRYRLVPDP